MTYQQIAFKIEELAALKMKSLMWLTVEEVEDSRNDTCVVVNDYIVVRKSKDNPGLFEIKIECQGAYQSFPMIGDLNLVVDMAIAHSHYRDGAVVLK